MDPRRSEPYGAITDAALALSGDRIAWVGPAAELPVFDETAVKMEQGGGAWITPGLIDCHTHLVYGGNRASEFEMRLKGVSYEDIARQGGGIRSTVIATRSESEEALYRAAELRLGHFLEEGVTGMEIKSGYGLDLDTELKMLRVARQLGDTYPLTVATTYLGAHTLPPEYQGQSAGNAKSADEYIDWICARVLPEVARLGLADAVDVFCESIAFNLKQSERVLRRARELGLAVKAHVEQLSNLGGARMAAALGALSVDHLEYLDDEGITALRKPEQEPGTVAVLLPGAFYFLGETQLPPVQALRAARVPIAIASDSNPGSSPTNSLLLMLNMACTLFQLTPEEALTGVTLHGAQALGWQDQRGSISVGKQADFVLWDIQEPGELAYRFGHNPCLKVVQGGVLRLERSAGVERVAQRVRSRRESGP